jgi:hypothetical protein
MPYMSTLKIAGKTTLVAGVAIVNVGPLEAGDIILISNDVYDFGANPNSQILCAPDSLFDFEEGTFTIHSLDPSGGVINSQDTSIVNYLVVRP